MIEFDVEQEKPYSARIGRGLLQDIKKGIDNYVFRGKRYRFVNYTAKQLAEDIGTNTRYLSAAIRLYYSCNFAELVNKLRIEEAKQMLLDVNCTLSMEDIAWSAGFAKRQSFYNAFAKFVGVKPREWREQQLAEQRREAEARRDALKASNTFVGLDFD